MNILVVDDNEGDRYLIKRYINKPGQDINVLEAGTAQEAYAVLDSHKGKIDCVFIDYMLPDADGISVLRRYFDKDKDFCPFPVVMLTGQGSESIAIDAIRYGAQDYLIKDNISTDTLHVAVVKARQVYELKKSRYESIKFMEYSQKMEAIGKLTGGIAHDFNNLLTITFGNIRLVIDMLQEPDCDIENCIDNLRTIQKTTRRGADLVKQLMIFSRQRKLNPVTANLNQLISDTSDLMQRSLGEFIQVKTEFDDDLHMVNVDPGQFEHALINMGVNARDAMMDGGQLTIKTENVVLSVDEARGVNLTAGSYVKLTVSDTGTGISEEVLGRVFDPFFTTKEVGKGTGLGLSMVYGFVKESKGEIVVESSAEHGTKFSLYFPVLQTEDDIIEFSEDDIALAFTSDNTTGGGESILVVEDEEEIRFLTSALLKQKGYTVFEAANGNEALEFIQNNGHHIDLLFTDIAMPGDMNGVQMAARVQVLKPDIKFLFTSGYASKSLPDMELIEHYPMIDKPYQPDDLMFKIRKTLDIRTGS